MKQLTQSQEEAIASRGDVLVVAGAGTGKTSTLVCRCLNLLLEEDCSLEEILMVTFTEAAAAQMRSRIRSELLSLQTNLSSADAGALLRSKRQNQVRKQLALLDSAHICTLHSFCLQIVRTHFYQLGIDPALNVLDEKQTGPLRSQTLDALFQHYYTTDTLEETAVQELIQDLGGGSDGRIRERIIKIHRYAQALEDTEGWLARQEAIYLEEKPLAWREWLEAAFLEWRAAWLPELGLWAHVPGVGEFLQTLEKLPAQPGLTRIIKALSQLVEIHETPQHWPSGSKRQTEAALRPFLAEMEFLASAAGTSNGTDSLQQDWEWVRPHACTLLRLTREFTTAFSKAKREMGGVDFADLEQFALRLLRDPVIAAQWQERLRFIFVDEYQDINQAQDAIIRALSGKGPRANRFLVGDVKQSIYRFRLANPKIFCRYEELWRKPDGGGTRIPLSDNFRSREALLQFFNQLFTALMRPEVGGISYPPDVHLRFGCPEKRKPLSVTPTVGDAKKTHLPNTPCVEFHLIDRKNTEVEAPDLAEEPSRPSEFADFIAIELEARLVAIRLQQLRRQKHPIWDEATGEFRAAEWRDMVVLMRSPAGRVEAFAKEFNRLGIPLAASRSGFFQSSEILDLLNLLRLIDNPQQDLPLLAVLRSPLAGFSLDELAQIRARQIAGPFWAAFQNFPRNSNRADRPQRNAPPEKPEKVTISEQNPPSPEKMKLDNRSSLSKPGPDALFNWAAEKSQPALHTNVSRFLNQFQNWRELACQSSLSHCLEMILSETYYEALLLAEPRGEERVANVRQFLKLASDYDPYQRQGLYRFLRFVDQQEDAEVELEPASAQTENAVRLMSIHKSKGLEFPVVVLAALGTGWNFQDLHQDILLHETYGLCTKVKPPSVDQSYPSVAHWLAHRAEKRELFGEEMRLLYVALTRARDTLILTGSTKNLRWTSTTEAPFPLETKGERDLHPQNTTLTTREILSARSYLDWFAAWLPKVTTSADWANEREGKTRLFNWKTYTANDSRLLHESKSPVHVEKNQSSGKELDELALLKLKEKILWTYPHAAASVEPAIKRVSTLIWARAEGSADAQLLFNYERPKASEAPSQPRKRSAGTLAAADVGVAYHRFLEMVDLKSVSRLEDLKEQAARMLQEGALLEAELKAVDLPAVHAFWTSEVGQKILSRTANVNREIPFTARLSPQDFAALKLCANAQELEGEYFVVRGKADLAVLLPKEIWLLDFKTDRLNSDEVEEVVRLYAPQIILYGLGLSRIYRRPVTYRWLHFFSLGKTVTV